MNIQQETALKAQQAVKIEKTPVEVINNQTMFTEGEWTLLKRLVAEAYISMTLPEQLDLRTLRLKMHVIKGRT